MSFTISELAELGYQVSIGRPLVYTDLRHIAENLDVNRINPEFLPGASTVSGTIADRRQAIFRVANCLWNVSSDFWLQMENTWLKNAREKSGSKEIGGKDDLGDVISAVILVRIVATSKLLTCLAVTDADLYDFALKSLNITIGEAVIKGRSRILRVEGKTLYGHLKEAGVVAGSGGSKYLPDPTSSLPFLFKILRKEILNPAVFQ